MAVGSIEASDFWVAGLVCVTVERDTQELTSGLICVQNFLGGSHLTVNKVSGYSNSTGTIVTDFCFGVCLWKFRLATLEKTLAQRKVIV